MIAELQTAGVSSFFLEDELVLFSRPAGRLYRLNTSGAFIWCCLEEGLPVEAIAARVAENFGISPDTALRDVREILKQWRGSGLLAGGVTPPPPETEPRNLISIESALHERPSSSLSRFDRFYEIAGHAYQVRFPDDEAEQAVAPVLAHMERPPAERCSCRFMISRGLSGFVLTVGNNPVASCDHISELAPLIHGHFLLATCEIPDCLTVIHAAAVSDGARCILLPGDSGSGKSTLAAGLVGTGFTYFSDEIALLTRRPFRILPVPLSLSIKEGSWSILAPFFPAIQTLPIFLRQDGKKVRYLAPPSHSLPEAGATGLPVAAIVFPRYSSPGTAIVPVSSAEALCRIAAGGYDFSSRMEKEMVGELITWISRVPCYELPCADLRQAVCEVKELFL
jgi:hypothetical protein